MSYTVINYLVAAVAIALIFLAYALGRRSSSSRKDLEREVAEQSDLIYDMQQRVISGIGDIMENRDGSTGGHVKRTSKIVNLLAKAMEADGYPRVTADFVSLVTAAASLHDLGKISIPDSVLCNPGILTEEEFGAMKGHTVKGEGLAWRLLHGVENPYLIEIAGNIARNHHERWDGKGYPDRLEAEDIPLEARIMAVADVYDALVSKRVYKEPMSFEQAYEVIDFGFGTQFDPALKKYFDICRKDIESFYEEEKHANNQ